MKYLKLFANHSAYDSVKDNLDKPNVSLCAQENEIHYNPFVDSRIEATFTISDTTNPVYLYYNSQTSLISKLEIDGVVQQSVNSQYTFSTTGNHIVKYTLVDPSTIGTSLFAGCSKLTSIHIPKSITSIGNGAFQGSGNLNSIFCDSEVAPTLGNNTVFRNVGQNGVLTVPIGSTGYDVWMSSNLFYLGWNKWTKVEQ